MYLINENPTDLINAIGELWKLVALIVLLVFFILFREPIKDWLLRFKRVQVKKGDTEVILEGDEVSDKIIEDEKLGRKIAEPYKVKEEIKQLPEPILFNNMIDAFIQGDFVEAENIFNE